MISSFLKSPKSQQGLLEWQLNTVASSSVAPSHIQLHLIILTYLHMYPSQHQYVSNLKSIFLSVSGFFSEFLLHLILRVISILINLNKAIKYLFSLKCLTTGKVQILSPDGLGNLKERWQTKEIISQEKSISSKHGGASPLLFLLGKNLHFNC